MCSLKLSVYGATPAPNTSLNVLFRTTSDESTLRIRRRSA
jgi:hypothetical protein